MQAKPKKMKQKKILENLLLKHSKTMAIIYHRHPLGATDGNNREVCIERLRFADDGRIQPVKITFEGVPAVSLQ